MKQDISELCQRRVFLEHEIDALNSAADKKYADVENQIKLLDGMQSELNNFNLTVKKFKKEIEHIDRSLGKKLAGG